MTRATRTSRGILQRGVRGEVDMTFTGFEELDRKFREMPVTMQKKAMRPAAREVAKLVRLQALASVPRKTGALAKSLVVRAAKRSRRHKDQVAVSVRTRDGFFKGDQFYGGMIEFGTGDRWTRGRGRKNARSDSGRRVFRGRIPEFKFLRNSLYSFPERKRRFFHNAIRRWMREQQVKAAANDV